MSIPIKVKTGSKSNLPTLSAGEFGFCTDTYELYIGDSAANHKILTESDFDAQTILRSIADNTPSTLTVAEQTLIGRITGGNIDALTPTQIRTLINVEDGATNEPGPQGDQGDQGFQGDQGETGEQGDQGFQGETGEQGPQGEIGDQGETGEQGDQGNQGFQGETGEQGPQGSGTGGLTWSEISTDTTAEISYGYLIDASSNTIDLTLPGNPSQGDQVAISDFKSTALINTITILRNGKSIEGLEENLTINISGVGLSLIYSGDETEGWEIFYFSGGTGAQGPAGSSYFTESFTAGENFISGQIGYLKSDQKIWKTLADAEATSGSCMIVLATDTITAEDTGTFLVKGFFQDSTSFDLTIGSVQYLSETVEGEITETAPSGVSEIVRIVGYAIDTDTLFFDPDKSWVEI